MKKDKKQIAALERFKHFKSFYIDRTKEYFLCDFYEIVMPDNSIFYKVAINMKHIHKQTLELRQTTIGKWEVTEKTEKIPFELQEHLSNCIMNICLKKV